MQREADATAAASQDRLAAIERRLSWQTTAIFFVALVLLFDVAVIYGYIVEFHAGEGLLIGSASASGAVMGFLFGWLAHRAIARR